MMVTVMNLVQQGGASSVDLGVSAGVDGSDIFTDDPGLVLLLQMRDTGVLSGDQEVVGLGVRGQGGSPGSSFHFSGSRRLDGDVAPAVALLLLVVDSAQAVHGQSDDKD